MKKGVIIILALLISLLPVVSGSSDTTICTDSDDGIDYDVKGVTCVGNNCKTDVCLTDNSYYNLKEYYCQSDSMTNKNYKCPDDCVNGACVEDYEIAGCKPFITCRNYPEICPPHGTQTRKCKDPFCKTVDSEEIIECTPGVCIAPFGWTNPGKYGSLKDYVCNSECNGCLLDGLLFFNLSLLKLLKWS